jgi:hypothetical protein
MQMLRSGGVAAPVMLDVMQMQMQMEGARAALCSHWPELLRASGSRSRTLGLSEPERA